MGLGGTRREEEGRGGKRRDEEGRGEDDMMTISFSRIFKERWCRGMREVGQWRGDRGKIRWENIY